jgi:hypothetical protein
MRYDDHNRVLYLISVAKYHHMRLNVLKKVCLMVIKKLPTTLSVIKDMYSKALRGNKHHYMYHLLFAKLHLGCNLMYMDTESSEKSHKPYVKDAFQHSSKRISSRLPEMITFVLKKKLVVFLQPLLREIDAENAVGGGSAGGGRSSGRGAAGGGGSRGGSAKVGGGSAGGGRSGGGSAAGGGSAGGGMSGGGSAGGGMSGGWSEGGGHGGGSLGNADTGNPTEDEFEYGARTSGYRQGA